MALTGRFPLLLLLGMAAVVLRPEVSTAFLWLVVVLLVAGLDVLLAPRPTALAVQRRPVGTVRLGHPAESVLALANESRRTVRGVVRDAWQPTAGATDNRHRVRLDAGDRVLGCGHRCCRAGAVTCVRSA